MPRANTRMIRSSLALLLAGTLLGAGGCVSGDCPAPRQPCVRAVDGIPPARINHVVFFNLKDPADAPALIDDCREQLATIPGVTSLFCGQHFETGRDKVLADYDVGLYVGLESAEAYSAYLAHPSHLVLVEEWGPRFESYRVYDIEDVQGR